MCFINLNIIKKFKTREANLESDAEKQTLYDSIRKTYIEAHKTPMINIDQIWKDYILFENVFIYF